MKTTSTAAARATRESNSIQMADAYLEHIGTATKLLGQLARHGGATKLVGRLTRRLDDIGITPDQINVGHIEEAARLVEVLKEAARGCNLIGEEE